jgi:signal transduction histidine kinase
MSARAELDEPSEPIGQRIKAERDALLELIAIFTHDLSNPLQSLTVLCELALDESPAGSDDYTRTRQCLEAADRMRKLIHGLAGVTRHAEGPGHLAGALHRVLGLLARRFDRHGIDLTIDIDAIDRVVPPRGIEFALLNLFLGLVTAASEQRLSKATVELVGRRNADGSQHGVELRGDAQNREGQRQPLKPAERHIRRVQHFIQGQGLELHTSDESVVLSFEASSEN